MGKFIVIFHLAGVGVIWRFTPVINCGEHVARGFAVTSNSHNISLIATVSICYNSALTFAGSFPRYDS